MDTQLSILVVEDNDDLREATVEALLAMGYTVCGIDSAEAVDDVIGKFHADLMVLDLNLPGENGLSLAQRLRTVNPDIGIVMVTARNRANDITTGYDSGADIYLTKPTSFAELGAAIQALSRRLRPRISAGGLTLKQATRQLHGSLATVDLSSLEYTMLAALAQAHEHSLENWQLIEISGKDTESVSKAALEVQIVRLRKKLEKAGATSPSIKVIRGTGYQLCLPIEIRQHDEH